MNMITLLKSWEEGGGVMADYTKRTGSGSVNEAIYTSHVK